MQSAVAISARAMGAYELTPSDHAFLVDAPPSYAVLANGLEAGNRISAKRLGRVPRERNSESAGARLSNAPAAGIDLVPVSKRSNRVWELRLCGTRSHLYTGAIFTHQFSQAWLHLQNQRDGPPFEIDYFHNSATATRAHRAFCLSLRSFYPSFSENLWGITPSDSNIGGPDVPGIDLGITLVSAENLRSGRVWNWFMQADAVEQGIE